MKRSAGSVGASANRSLNIQKKTKTINTANLSESSVATLTLKHILPQGVGSLVTQDSHGNHIIQIQNDSEMGETSMVCDDDMPNDSCDMEASGVIAQHMDITEPLTTLRSLLEQRVGFSLAEYSFYLQDAQELDASKNLVNQCVQGEGLVQVNVEITEKDYIKKINIVDVLKPAEEIVTVTSESAEIGQPAVIRKVVPNEEAEQVTRWVASPEFREQQEKLKIPAEPSQWKPSHVHHWIQWAVNHFNLQGITLNEWIISGKELCDLSHGDFTKKVPNDPNDLFWTHLELLRKCQIVAVVQQPSYTQQVNQIYTIVTKTMQARNKPKASRSTTPRVAYEGCPGNRSGNNGQIQLWQFLLEMLTDFQCRDYIQWIGVDGEFKLNNPEMVAQLWGQRKNKPTMNYEKLSRALRYYYDGDMIAKVHGKRFVYKFVCDLKSLLGYSAAELKRLVNSCCDGQVKTSTASSGTVVPYMVELNQGLVLANADS